MVLLVWSLVVPVCSLVVLVCLLAALICPFFRPILLLVCPLVVSVCTLVVLVVQSVSLFITNLYYVQIMLTTFYHIGTWSATKTYPIRCRHDYKWTFNQWTNTIKAYFPVIRIVFCNLKKKDRRDFPRSSPLNVPLICHETYACIPK